MSFFRNLTQKINQALKSPAPAVKFTAPPSNAFNVRPVQPAEEMINQVKPVEIEGSRIGCDGGNGPLGHPMVYINLDGKEPQPCGYCGLRFVQKHGHHHH
ncbi:hypothetical protein RB653_007883 [Dictyostelium firmibasis]|uniref:Zinc finger CHCC-type domain-containing protein n=1 Tax=Dictyostelium firmibasis TaxID=79012 RepID=A0AAN7YMD7_9MYCE